LCSGQPEIFRAARNNLPLPMVGGGFLQSRKPMMLPDNKPLYVQSYGSR
jgi:hypothetical protein